ncbi:hypothetical protein TNCV_1058981 [Trichonephila clavipes]|nr:hypothetical protein TNCV_1058981 [Trichonephila clavipes]
MIVEFRNEKVSNHGSIPITIDCNVVAFIVFEEGFHQPIKRTKQSASSAKNKIRLHENREQRQSFGPFDESTPCLDDRFDELPNQTENKSHLTAVKSVAILEIALSMGKLQVLTGLKASLKRAFWCQRPRVCY